MSMIQLAIPIERGNSGGPVVDLEGKVVGILTLKSLVTENLGFAVAINSLKPLLEKPNPIAMGKWLTIGALDPRHWQVVGDARWTQHAGRMRADGPGKGFGGRSLCLSTQSRSRDAVRSGRAASVCGEQDGAAGLVFHSDGGDRHYGFYPTSGKLRVTRFDGPVVYDWHVLWEEPRDEYKPDAWNELKIRVEKDRIQCLCNGAVVYELQDDFYRKGKVGLAKFRHTTAEFKGFRVGEQIEERQIDDADAQDDRVVAHEAPANAGADDITGCGTVREARGTVRGRERGRATREAGRLAPSAGPRRLRSRRPRKDRSPR